MDYKNQIIKALIGYVIQRDIYPGDLKGLENFDPSRVNSDLRINLTPDVANQLWRDLENLSGDELFGLHFGESLQLTALGIVGQIVSTSNSVGDALEKAVSMISMVTDDFRVVWSLKETEVLIEIEGTGDTCTLYPFLYKNVRDFIGAFVVHELDGLLVRKIIPSSIGVPYSDKTRQEYCRVFRCKNIFFSESIKLYLDRDLLALPIVTANYELHRHLESLLPEMLASFPSESRLLKEKVGRYILKNSYLKIHSNDEVAANFNMGARTLQRKLRSEESSFSEIIDDVRKNLAIKYLKEREHPIKEIAYVLGYNESSAFVRAFKRWTGTTPTLYSSEG